MMTVSMVMPEAGLLAVVAMALAATEVKKNAKMSVRIRPRIRTVQETCRRPKKMATQSAPATTPRRMERMGMSRSVRSGVRGFAVTEGVQCDAEGAGNDAQRFEDADDSRGGDGAYADEAHVVAIDFDRGHFGDGNDGGIDGHVNVTANEPDERHQNKAGHDAAGAEDHCAAQAHNVAKAEDEADGVEAEDHAAAIGKCCA